MPCSKYDAQTEPPFKSLNLSKVGPIQNQIIQI